MARLKDQPMTVDEMIRRLTRIQEDYGDLKIRTEDEWYVRDIHLDLKTWEVELRQWT